MSKRDALGTTAQNLLDLALVEAAKGHMAATARFAAKAAKCFRDANMIRVAKRKSARKRIAQPRPRSSDATALLVGQPPLADPAKGVTDPSAAGVLATFDAALVEFADAIISEKPRTRDAALRTLQVRWRVIRERHAKPNGAEAAAVPQLPSAAMLNAQRHRTGELPPSGPSSIG